MKLDTPRGQHPDAECERSSCPLGRDNVRRNAECCPMSASSWGIGTKGLQRVSQHGSLGLYIVTDGHEISPVMRVDSRRVAFLLSHPVSEVRPQNPREQGRLLQPCGWVG
jgi:hypothetical protein